MLILETADYALRKRNICVFFDRLGVAPLVHQITLLDRCLRDAHIAIGDAIYISMAQIEIWKNSFTRLLNRLVNSWVMIRLVACIEEHGDLHKLIALLVLIADPQVVALLRRRVMRCLVQRAFTVLVHYERRGLLLVLLLVLGAIVLRRVRLNIKVAGRAGL